MATTDEVNDAEIIELEPTLVLAMADPAAVARSGGRLHRGRIVQLDGSQATLLGETHGLRRKRLTAVALFLAVAVAVVILWSAFVPASDTFWIVLVTNGVRFALAAAIAGLLLSSVSLTWSQLRGLEYLLFGGFTVLMAINQYVVNVDLLRQGDLPGVVAVVKNGVFGMVMLMILYGMFIPNDPRTTAKVVLTMALVQVIVLVLVLEHPHAVPVVNMMRTSEKVGFSILSLFIGAGLAIYGSFVLNGLRNDLHEARKLGQYQLIRRIGEGGMGEVYLAEHQLLKRPCALKLIRPEAVNDPIALARFAREVQAASRLAHPNTIEIYDYGHSDDGTFYYVMEYLQGMSLGDLVRSAGPLPPGRVVYLFRQICAGLAEAHALGLVHRDLKPANIFIAVRGGESDVVKVLDFGLVKLMLDPGAETLTSVMTVSGTPMYMAPEQAEGDKALDARADIYALGALLYFTLTGQPPFKGESAFAVLTAHARDPVVPPSQVNPSLPADLEKVALRCLAKKPADRYPTVKALGEALLACASAGDWGRNRADAWWASIGMTESPPVMTEA